MLGAPTSQIDFDDLNMDLTHLSPLGSEAMHGGNAMNITLAYYCNPEGPWFQKRRSQREANIEQPQWQYGSARRLEALRVCHVKVQRDVATLVPILRSLKCSEMFPQT